MNEKLKTELGNLIVNISLGDVSAVDKIYGLIGNIMHSIAYSILLNDEDAEDAVHDALVLLVRKAKKFRYMKNAYAWIYIITKNTSLNIFNKRKKRKEEDLEIAATIRVEINEDKIFVKQILERLKPYDRELLIYRYWYGLTYIEIGELLGKPKTTISTQVLKLEEKLRNLYNFQEKSVQKRP